MALYIRNVFIGVLCGLLGGFFLGNFRAANSRDLGQWDRSDPVTEWYQKLLQPDNPTVSCCGEADAYWCDDYYSRDGKAYCKITDDRPDEERGRPHREVGQEFEIPNH